MVQQYDVVGIGYPSLDYTIRLNAIPIVGQTAIITNSKSVEPFYGGCAVNITYLLSSFGKKCGVSMTVGKDFEKTGYKKFLENNHVSLEFVQENDRLNTSYTNLIMFPNGEHMTLFYPGPMTSELFEPYDFSKLETKYGLLSIGEINGNKQFLDTCIERNIPIIFSMKGDYNALDEEYLYKVFDHSELIFMNDSEFHQLNRYLPKKVLEYLGNDHLKAIIVTGGDKGSTIYSGEDDIIIPAYPDTNVVDTAGGGDAYIAGFLMRYLEQQDWQACGITGSSLASFIIEDYGCLTNVPTVAQLEEREKRIREEMKT